MNIRQGTIEEFKALWHYSESHTYNYFLSGLTGGNIEFWTVDNNGLIGELYIFWDSEDKEEADGIKRAYLCALRIKPEHQGAGLSTLLMKSVMNRIYEKGYTEITIGIDNDDYDKLLKVYQKWGFTTRVKLQEVDYHYRDKDNKIFKYEKPIELYMKINLENKV